MESQSVAWKKQTESQQCRLRLADLEFKSHVNVIFYKTYMVNYGIKELTLIRWNILLQEVKSTALCLPSSAPYLCVVCIPSLPGVSSLNSVFKQSSSFGVPCISIYVFAPCHYLYFVPCLLKSTLTLTSILRGVSEAAS